MLGKSSALQQRLRVSVGQSQVNERSSSKIAIKLVLQRKLCQDYGLETFIHLLIAS